MVRSWKGQAGRDKLVSASFEYQDFIKGLLLLLQEE
jgi:hypothetical protein